MVLGEVRSPGRDLDPEITRERIRAFEQAGLAAAGQPAGLAVLDGILCEDFYRAWELADALSPENRDRHLVYFSGRNHDGESALAALEGTRKQGIVNLSAVSGSAMPEETPRKLQSRRFFESTRMLRLCGERADREAFFAGATVNPFQYSADSLFAQLAKLMRKVRSGAQFVVAECNWDMLKLQALRWYLNSRNCFIPSLARLMFLTPERVERILGGRYQGIVISPDFHEILNKELRFSRSQFESAQWRRIELQAAGCRLLGYSGVQLAGLDKPEQLTLAADRIAGAMREFTDFNDWLQAYNSYQARAEMAPMPSSFYLYDRSLVSALPENGAPLMRQPDPAEVTGVERFRMHLAKFCFPHADRQSRDGRRLLKKLLVGCSGSCVRCRLPQTMFVCTGHCPKHLEGICGGIRPDGTCEVAGVGECVHRKIMRLARAYDRTGCIEDAPF